MEGTHKFLLNKLSSVGYIMRRLVHILNLETLKVVYFAHFHSLISYGITFWGNSPTMHKVFLVQKMILRIMLGLGPRCSCRSWFIKLGILPVPSLYIFLLICLFVIIQIISRLILWHITSILGVKINYIFQLFILPLYRKVLHILP
jgi:hypothetical protein